jgi:hypothetical protein
MQNSCRSSRTVPIFLILTQSQAAWQILIKVSNIKFYANPLSGRQFDMCKQTDVTRPVGTFCDSTNLPKNNKQWSNMILQYNPEIKHQNVKLNSPACVEL